jgi:hypothetical protein
VGKKTFDAASENMGFAFGKSSFAAPVIILVNGATRLTLAFRLL